MVLKKPFPATFYMPYKTENYALCFDCHNKDIALNQFTTKLTDFRNGDLNLHYLHVNKDPKGRSCTQAIRINTYAKRFHSALNGSFPLTTLRRILAAIA